GPRCRHERPADRAVGSRRCAPLVGENLRQPSVVRRLAARQLPGEKTRSALPVREILRRLAERLLHGLHASLHARIPPATTNRAVSSSPSSTARRGGTPCRMARRSSEYAARRPTRRNTSHQLP